MAIPFQSRYLIQNYIRFSVGLLIGSGMISTDTKFSNDLHMHNMCMQRTYTIQFQCNYRTLYKIPLPILILCFPVDMPDSFFLLKSTFIISFHSRFINFRNLTRPTGSSLMVIIRYSVINEQRNCIFVGKLCLRNFNLKLVTH